MRQKHHLEGLAALLLFGVFAVCVLMVLLTGADTYHRLNRRDQSAYDARTAAQYITTKVRQTDWLDCVSVERFGDGDALVLADDIDGERYVTRVYTYDGYLMELFSALEDEMAPEDGERLMPLEGLAVSMIDRRLDITCGEGETQTQFVLVLRSGAGGAV